MADEKADIVARLDAVVCRVREGLNDAATISEQGNSRLGALVALRHAIDFIESFGELQNLASPLRELFLALDDMERASVVAPMLQSEKRSGARPFALGDFDKKMVALLAVEASVSAGAAVGEAQEHVAAKFRRGGLDISARQLRKWRSEADAHGGDEHTRKRIDKLKDAFCAHGKWPHDEATAASFVDRCIKAAQNAT